ncbi:MAG: TRAP transporter substrate-binding protein DctP [Woeseiaceae bacterium]|nr:TRAP transporter substrate-binding protein DctP [Woeseiaceae bacterium]
MQKLLVATALTLTVLIGGQTTASAADIKIATIVPNQSAWMVQMREAGKTIRERTEGRVNLKFYGGGVQGASPKVLQKIKIGQLHGGVFSPTDFMKTYGDVNLYGLPFVFESWEEMRYVREQMDAELAAGFEELNFVTFGFVGSFSMILSNEPVRNQSDLRGKKVWLPEGDLITFEALKALNLSPVSLPVTDVLTGLQTGLLDMAAIPPEVAVALQWHTRVKYFTDMPVLYAMSFLAIDKRTMDRLSGEDRAVLEEVLRDTYASMDQQSSADSLDAVEALVDIGIDRVEPDAGELEELLATMSDTNLAMAQKGILPLSLFETMQGHIHNYRNNSPQGDAGPLSGN